MYLVLITFAAICMIIGIISEDVLKKIFDSFEKIYGKIENESCVVEIEVEECFFQTKKILLKILGNKNTDEYVFYCK